MSALAGFWSFTGRPGAGAACERMLEGQKLYGPHDSGHWDAGSIALGRNLFRTLPEDAYDYQPLTGGAGRFVLAGDLRLDNRDSLAAELRIEPAQARTLPDAAFLLAAWERWGEDCLDRLVGDYAFALWDAAERRLVLARDPVGLRPLHYHRGKDFFAFATMPKGLHTLPQIPRAPDEARTTEIFALVPEHGSRSFFLGIERVEPGRIVTVTPDRVSARRHWNPPRKILNLKSADDYAQALREQLDIAVLARLRGADGKVGAHLSGGIDSAAVAATAARLLAPQGGKVVAFTAVPGRDFAGKELRGRFGDEGPLAAATAALYPNIEHVPVRTDGRTPMDNLDRNFFVFERPIVNICNQVWYDAMNDAAKQRRLTVMLGAPAGNLSMSYDGAALLPELFAQGHWLRWIAQMRAGVRKGYRDWPSALAGSIGPWVPVPLWNAARRLVRGNALSGAQGTATNRTSAAERGLDARAQAAGMDLAFRPKRMDAHALRLWAFERTDLGNYFKGWLGGWGVDVRDPSADRRLIEFCLSVPLEQFLRDGEPRALARLAFADRLPQAVLQERRRGMQAADWYVGATAARAQLREEIDRLEQSAPASAALDIARLRALVADWPSDGWEREEVYTTYRFALLRGISTGHFLRKASGGNA